MMANNPSVLQAFIFIIIAYLAGSIPTGVWYSRFIHRTDVRSLGSGNSGGTNVGRNFGPVAGAVVITVDVLKGWIPMMLAMSWFYGTYNWAVALVGLACVLGHAYPIWGGFKGGKIVATSFGVLVGFNFWLALIGVIFLLILLYFFSMVSLAAMMSYTLVTVIIILNSPYIYGLCFTLITLLMIYRHKENIDRIVQGQERRVNFGLKKRDKQK